VLGLGLVAHPGLAGKAHAAVGGADTFGPLQAADVNGLMLPPGFSSRVVATTGQIVSGTSYTWHGAPDGGATFSVAGGGWVYVSNSEVGGGAGGASAIRFDALGSITDAYSILSGTSINCAGGPTPWNTWISCEEFSNGRAFECDPFNLSVGVVRAGLGTFKHEAAGVDPQHQNVYLTEDVPDGLLYRSVHSAWPDLDLATLEAAEILDPLGQGAIAPGQTRPLSWHPIADGNPIGGGIAIPSHIPLAERATRYQAPSATAFNGGEGCWYDSGIVYFATKGDQRVWMIDTFAETIEILYERSSSSDPELQNVDNVYVSPCGDVYVAEDPGNLEIVALTPLGDVKPIVRLTGIGGTEITGPALSPDGTRLYFSSQRNPGTTFEVTGAFAAAPMAAPAIGGIGPLLLASALGALGALSTRKVGRES